MPRDAQRSMINNMFSGKPVEKDNTINIGAGTLTVMNEDGVVIDTFRTESCTLETDVVIAEVPQRKWITKFEKDLARMFYGVAWEEAIWGKSV